MVTFEDKALRCVLRDEIVLADTVRKTLNARASIRVHRNGSIVCGICAGPPIGARITGTFADFNTARAIKNGVAVSARRNAVGTTWDKAPIANKGTIVVIIAF